MTARAKEPGTAETARRLEKSSTLDGYAKEDGAAGAVSTVDFQGAQLARIRAQARINDAKALAAERARKGQHVDADAFAFIIAQALASALPGRVYSGPMKVHKGSGIMAVESRAAYMENRDRRAWYFAGATREQLERHLAVAITADAGVINRALAAAGEFAVSQSSTRLCSAAVAGRTLQVSTLERENLELRTLQAVDMPASERRAREREARKLADAERKRKARREKSMKPRAVYEAQSLEKTKPWQAAGMSRRTWFRRSKIGQLGRDLWFGDQRLQEAVGLVAEVARNLRKVDRETARHVLAVRYHVITIRLAALDGEDEANMRLRRHALSLAIWSASIRTAQAGHDATRLQVAEKIMRLASLAA